MRINLQPELKRHYIAIGSLSVIIAGIVLVNLFGSTRLRHDYRLERKISDIQQSVDSYVSSKNKLPEILPDSGVKESGGVEYKKISNERYMLCAVFKTKSDGYNMPDPTYLEELQSESLRSGVALDANTHFTNGNNEGLKHNKGYSCIVYQPYQLSSNYVNPYRLCDEEKFKQPPLYSQTIQSVNYEARQIVIRSADVKIMTPGSRSETPPSINRTFTLSPDAKIYDLNCKEISFGSLKEGDIVEIYQNANDAVIDGLRLTYTSTLLVPPQPRTVPNNNLQ